MLTEKHIKALKRAIDEAEVWRGSLTGSPYPEDLEAFDNFIATARQGLAEVKALKKQRV